MAGIFISYRREDSQADARSLLLTLRQHFGEDIVFMDVTGILPGLDFRKEIDQWVQRCDVFLVVIGKRWTEIQRARANDAHDFVRLEVVGALRRDIPVIPVLVQGAVMPGETDLPEDLKELCYRNAVNLHHENWDSDARALIGVIETLVGKPAQAPKAEAARVDAVQSPAASAAAMPTQLPSAAPPRSRSWIWAAALGAALAVVGGYLAIERRSVPQRPTGPEVMKPRASVPAAPPEVRDQPRPALAQVAVPAVRGLKEADARAALASAGLEAKTVREESENEAPGLVLRTDPESSAIVALGTPVTLHLATPPTVVVPRLVDLSRADAEQALGKAGLRVGSIAEKASAAVPGSVIATSAAAGQKVRKGTSVDLTLAVAPPATMPAVTGLAFPEAKRILGEARIRFDLQGTFMDASEIKAAQERGIYHPDGFVTRQEPPTATPVAPNTRVTLWVLRPPPSAGSGSAAPKSYSAGDLTLRGTLMADLDRGIEIQDGADFWWYRATRTERYLTPKNGARFSVLGQRDLERISYANLRQRVTYSGARIDGSDGTSNRLPVGTVVAYVTDQGRYGKFLVRAQGNDLSIRWVTYDAAR